jgi:hypothetical protein
MISCNTKEDTVVPLLSGFSCRRPSLLSGQISDALRLLNISKSREATPLTRPLFFHCRRGGLKSRELLYTKQLTDTFVELHNSFLLQVVNLHCVKVKVILNFKVAEHSIFAGF